MKIVIAKVPTGHVELVHVGGRVLLQFNCACVDALTFCRGMCCSEKNGFTATLLPDEVDKFEHKRDRNMGLFTILYNGKDGRCYSQQDSGLCGIHNDRPYACRNWHCSPGGVGEGIETRDNGWLLAGSVPAGAINDQHTA